MKIKRRGRCRRAKGKVADRRFEDSTASSQSGDADNGSDLDAGVWLAPAEAGGALVAEAGGAPGQRVPREAILYGCGYLKLRADVYSLDAHCQVCGVKFDRSLEPFGGKEAALAREAPLPAGRRSSQGRPMGRHCFFLDRCPGDAAQHKKAMWDLGLRADQGHDARVRSRLRGLRHPALAPLFAAEDAGPHRRRLVGGSVVPADCPQGEPYDMA